MMMRSRQMNLKIHSTHVLLSAQTNLPFVDIVCGCFKFGSFAFGTHSFGSPTLFGSCGSLLPFIHHPHDRTGCCPEFYSLQNPQAGTHYLGFKYLNCVLGRSLLSL